MILAELSRMVLVCAYDEERLHADSLQPFSNGMGRKLRPVVRSDVRGHTSADEQVAEALENM